MPKNNYRPVKRLSTTWKLLSGIVFEPTGSACMSSVQNGISCISKGANHQLLVDWTVTNDKSLVKYAHVCYSVVRATCAWYARTTYVGALHICTKPYMHANQTTYTQTCYIKSDVGLQVRFSYIHKLSARLVDGHRKPNSCCSIETYIYPLLTCYLGGKSVGYVVIYPKPLSTHIPLLT